MHLVRVIAICFVSIISYALMFPLASPSFHTAGFLSVPSTVQPQNTLREDEEKEEDYDMLQSESGGEEEHDGDDSDRDDGDDERYEATLPSQEVVLIPQEVPKPPQESKNEEKPKEIIQKERTTDKEELSESKKNPPSLPLHFGGGGLIGYKAGNVLFSEIAWMGSIGNSNEEWIELYNASDEEVILQGFTIAKADESFLVGELGDRFMSSHRIHAGGYFLLRRTSDAIAFAGEKAYDGSLNNRGETLILKDALGNEIDKIVMSKGWVAGSEKETVEGYRPTMSLLEGVWHNGIPTPRFPNKKVSSIKVEEPLPLSYASSTIIINEVAWMGNREGAANEWIELFSAASSSIDLFGWTLTIETQRASSTISLQGTIEGLRYFLLERSDDQSVPEIKGDFFYMGALSNEGARLLLRDPSGALIDEVPGSPWPAGDNLTKKTMQKINTAWISASPTPKAQNYPDLVLFPTPFVREEVRAFTPFILLINEIAWMGATASANHEWIELRNTTSTDILLNDWQLTIANDASSTPDTLIVFGTHDVIPAHSFFVLERGASSTLPTVNGNVYTGNAMNNTGEYLQLLDASGNIIDSVDASKGWPAGINKTSPEIVRRSMERIANARQWVTYEKQGTVDAAGQLIIDSKGNSVLGSPLCPNSSEEPSSCNFL